MSDTADQIEDGTAAMQIVVGALRALLPPPAAGERWVRDNALAIDEIARRAGFGRPALSLALLSAGVAQSRDRTRAISVTNLSRALAAGRKEAEGRRIGIDGQKLEALIVKTVVKMLPTITTDIARTTVEETVARLSPAFGAAPTPAPAEAPPPALAPQAPAPAAPPGNEFTSFAARQPAPSTAPAKPKHALEQLLDKPLEKLLAPTKPTTTNKETNT